MKYRIFYEKAPKNYGAWSPDLWGCVAVGDTLDECRLSMREAIELHLEGLAEDGDVRLAPAGYIEILNFEPERPKQRAIVKRKRPPANARTRGPRSTPPRRTVAATRKVAS